MASSCYLSSQVDLSVTNPEQLLTLMQEFILPSGNVTQARPAMDTLERSTRWIRHKLKIAERKLPPVQGDLRLQFGALVERIFPFDNKLPAMIDEGIVQCLNPRNIEPFEGTVTWNMILQLSTGCWRRWNMERTSISRRWMRRL